MGKRKKKVVGIILLFVIIIIVVYFMQPSVKTVEAVTAEYDDRVPFMGLYFTQEYVVYSGNIIKADLKAEDGEKVPSGMNIYNNINSTEAGLVCTHLDGYENKYNLNNIIKVNSKELENISKNNRKPGIKIINNSLWYIYARINKNIVFKKRRVYDLVIDNADYPSEVINLDSKPDGNYVLFRVNNDLNILNLHRNINGYIIKSRYNGIIIPDKALCSVTGKLGVFIENHGYAEFRRVNILFQSSDIAVITPMEKGKRLLEYDDIICNSVGLSDGTKIR